MGVRAGTVYLVAGPVKLVTLTDKREKNARKDFLRWKGKEGGTYILINAREFTRGAHGSKSPGAALSLVIILLIPKHSPPLSSSRLSSPGCASRGEICTGGVILQRTGTAMRLEDA